MSARESIIERVNAYLPPSGSAKLIAAWETCCSLWGPESPPAKGCILEFVRLRQDDPTLYVDFHPAESRHNPSNVPRWFVWTDRENPGGSSEMGALLAALESAPLNGETP